MDKEGRDYNITTQNFSTLAHGSQTQSQLSTATVTASIDPKERAIISLPRYPHLVFFVDLICKRMGIFDGWTQSNKTSQMCIPNFYTIVTGSGPDVQIKILTT